MMKVPQMQISQTKPPRIAAPINSCSREKSAISPMSRARNAPMSLRHCRITTIFEKTAVTRNATTVAFASIAILISYSNILLGFLPLP